MSHQDLGRRLMERLIQELKEFAEVERAPKMEGYSLIAIFMPKKVVEKIEKKEIGP